MDNFIEDDLCDVKASDFGRLARAYLDETSASELSRLVEKFAFLRLLTLETVFLKTLLDARPELETEVRPRIGALASFSRRVIDFEKLWAGNVFDAPFSAETGAEFDRALTDLAQGREVFTDEN